MNNYRMIVNHMNETNPDGAYNVADIMQYGWTYLDILQYWYHSYKSYGMPVPTWLVYAIQWLDSTLR